MDVSAIYTLSRTLTATDSTQMPDATLLVFANLVYHDLENAIVSRVNSDFFYQEWTTNSVIDQREYQLPIKSGTTAGCKKLLGISVKYQSTDTDYTKLRQSTLSSNEADIAYYRDGQPLSDPFFIIGDNSAFIYPDPEEAVTDGIKLYGVSNLGDIATGGTEVSVKIPIEHHNKISIGMAQYIFTARGAYDKASAMMGMYAAEKESMIRQLADRNLSPIESQLPSLLNLS